MATIGRQISMLSGYAPALPTPFADDGNIDVIAFEQFCDLQIQQGATALVVCGTTGEAPTLTPAEHTTLIQIAVAVAGGASTRDRRRRLEFNRPCHRTD